MKLIKESNSFLPRGKIPEFLLYLIANVFSIFLLFAFDYNTQIIPQLPDYAHGIQFANSNVVVFSIFCSFNPSY